MEINVIEEAKNKIVFELKGEDHTFCNALKKELWNDKHIKISGYNIEHPLVSEPKMVVETDGSINPKAALMDAAKRLMKTNDNLIKNISKEIK